MLTLAFRKRFAADVLSGKKRSSIRRSSTAKVGDTIHLFAETDTSVAQYMGAATCSEIHPVTVGTDGITISGVTINQPRELDRLANADGFADWTELLQFFGPIYGLPFDGNLIAWTGFQSGDQGGAKDE